MELKRSLLVNSPGGNRMKVSRRELLAGAAGAFAPRPPATAQTPPTSADPTRVRGRAASPLGQRAASAKLQRVERGATASGTPHQDLMGIITPSDLHFE